jgi:hypothetical protein
VRREQGRGLGIANCDNRGQGRECGGLRVGRRGTRRDALRGHCGYMIKSVPVPGIPRGRRRGLAVRERFSRTRLVTERYVHSEADGTQGSPMTISEPSGDACIAQDLPCEKCGYNLRTLLLSHRCPECGTEVMRSYTSHGRTVSASRCACRGPTRATLVLIATLWALRCAAGVYPMPRRTIPGELFEILICILFLALCWASFVLLVDVVVAIRRGAPDGVIGRAVAALAASGCTIAYFQVALHVF